MDKNLSTLLTFFESLIILAITIVLKRLIKESSMIPQQVIFSCAFSYDLDNLENIIEKIRSEVIHIISNRFLMRWPAKIMLQNLIDFVTYLKAEEMDEFFQNVKSPGEEYINFYFGFKFFGSKLRISGGFCIRDKSRDTVLYTSDPRFVNQFDVFSEVKE